MLLAALYNTILVMRRNWADSNTSGRESSALAAVGVGHIKRHYPTLATAIDADTAASRSLLGVAAAAIVGDVDFASALVPFELTLSPPLLGFFENSLTVAL
jgi:hypothetical protein